MNICKSCNVTTEEVLCPICHMSKYMVPVAPKACVWDGIERRKRDRRAQKIKCEGGTTCGCSRHTEEEE